jgi:hypothetical protein
MSVKIDAGIFGDFSVVAYLVRNYRNGNWTYWNFKKGIFTKELQIDCFKDFEECKSIVDNCNEINAVIVRYELNGSEIL